MNTTIAKQILARPCAVLVAGDAPEPAVLNAYDDLATAERHRKEWLAATARRPDNPAAATYPGSERRRPISSAP